MAIVDGATLLVRALQRQGISHLFSVSAGGMASVYRAAQEEGVTVVHTRHEGPAAFMADGWARVTRQIGACLVTHGVGVTNAMTGLAAAYMDGAPLLCLALGIPRARADLGNLQEMDHLAAVAPVTKWARIVPSAARIPEYVAAALRHAWEGQPGPVFLEIPGDLFAEPVDDTQVSQVGPVRPLPSAGDPAAVEAAARLLAAARRPVVFAGSGVWWSEAGRALGTLAERANLPIFTRRMGRAAISADHPLHFGMAWFSMNGVSLAAAAECDLLLVVGGHLHYDLEHGRAPYLNGQARIVQIDASPTEIGQNRPADVAIVGDAKLVLEQLDAALASLPAPSASRQTWLDRLRAARAEVEVELTPLRLDGGTPIHPLRLWSEVAAVVDDRTTIVTGQGDSDFWAELLLPPRAPGHYARSGRAGCLGTELAYGIAAKLAYPDDDVLVTVGDGGFGFSAMELETAARCGAPIVVIVSNDSGWTMIKAQQTATLGPNGDPFTELTQVDHARLAESLGCYGERVETAEQIGPALRRAFRAGRPAVLDVQIRPFTSPLIRWLCRGLPNPHELIGYPSDTPR
jgi:acetolactate synthase I/II/III large subunit